MNGFEIKKAEWTAALAAPLVAGAVLELIGGTWLMRPVLSAVLAATAVLVIGLGGASEPQRTRSHLTIEIGALLLAGLLAPSPWRYVLLAAALMSLLAGAGLGTSRRITETGKRLAWGLRTVVISAIPVVAIVICFSTLALTIQTLPGIASPLSAILRLLHIDAAAFGNSVAAVTLHGTPSIPMTWSNLGIFAWVTFLAAYLAIRSANGQRLAWAEVWQITLIMFITWILQVIVIFTAVFHYEMFLLFDLKEWPQGWLSSPLLQLLIMAVVASPLLATRMIKTVNRSPQSPPLRRWIYPSIALLALLAGFFLVFSEPGKQKPGRILVDEGHSRWEPVEPRYDTDWYGFDSGYNYAVMTDFLRHHYELAVHRDVLDEESLKGVDVLIIKVPTHSHTPEERKAVLDFVRRGGGLFLIGEHTNVWGSGFYLNKLAHPLGFEFRYDVVFDLERKFEQIYTAPALGKHPILEHINQFLFAVSCSIKPRSFSVRPVMSAGGLWSLDIDYAVSNFYPSPHLARNAVVGQHAQFIARHFGKGRVAGFTDSTVWSTFSAMLPGKPELLMGTIEWLNRRNRFPDTYPFGRVLFTLMGMAVIAAIWRWPKSAGIILSISTAGILAGARLGDTAGRGLYQLPHSKPGFSQICFIEDASTYDLASWGHVSVFDRSYSIFYQWVNRVGLFPKVITEESPLPNSTRAIIRIVGTSPPGPLTASNIAGALELGKPVFLLVRADADSGFVPLLANYGIRLVPGETRETPTLRVPNTSIEWPSPWRIDHEIQGGRPLLVGAQDEVILCVSKQAPLHILLGAERFSDAWMGEDQGRTPDLDLRRHYELEFSLLRGLTTGRLQEELKEGATRPVAVRSSRQVNGEQPLVDRPAGRHHEK
ncbi:MAG: hypothetical protein GTO29_14815 [Candidatus Latescibacteria bacterium]|nr:hypothetical protein [Candidatus Latescibacterota bacterium]NIO57422.1 hypothetical protein [Candidatus Latescibacterota bacterium]